MDTISSTLRELGLSEAAIKVYQTLLTRGTIPVSELMEQSGLSRKGVYDAIDILFTFDLVEYKKDGRAALYSAAHPHNLQKLIDAKKVELQTQEEQLRGIVHQFTSTYNLTQKKPGVSFFEGKEGLIKAYDELLEDGLDIDSIEDKGEMVEFIGDYAKTFVQERIKRKIHNRVIAPSTSTINVNDPKELRETQFIDVQNFPFEMDIKITDAKLVMTTFQEASAVGIIIVHPEIIKNYKILFEFMWKQAG